MIKTNNGIRIFLLISIIVSTIAISKSINKPFSMDEAHPISWNGHMIKEKGLSAFGERIAPGSEKTRLEVSHPALHFASMALFFKLFGETEWSGRLIGILGMIWTLIVLYKLFRLFNPTQESIFKWMLTATLYIINPFIIQYALLIDIDPSMLAPLLTTTVYCFMRYELEHEKKYLIWTGFWLLISFWAKEMTPPFFIISVFVYYLIQKKWKKAIINTSILFGLGLILFVITWIVFCKFTNTPVLVWVRHNFMNKGKGLDFYSLTHITTVIHFIKLMIFWLSPPILILFFCELIFWIKGSGKNIFNDPKLFLYTYIFTLILYTWFYIPMMTNFVMLKYNYPIYPIIFFLIGNWISPYIKELKLKHFYLSLLFIFMSLGYYLLIKMEDPILLLHRGGLQVLSLRGISLMIPWIVLIIFIKLISRQNSWMQAFIYSSLISVLSTNIFLNIKQTRNYTTAPSWHEYGQTGLQETIEFLAANIDSTANLMIRKDIGYHLNFHYHFDQIQWFYPIFRGTEEEISTNFYEVINNSNISYMTLDPTMNLKVSQKIIDPFFELDRQFGDFYIYKRKEFEKHENLDNS